MMLYRKVKFLFFTLVVICFFLFNLETCSKKKITKKTEEDLSFEIMLNSDKSLKTLKLLQKDQATLSYLQATNIEFMKNAEGFLQINSFETPEPSWFFVETRNSKASYFWEIAQEYQNQHPYLTLTVVAENRSQQKYFFTWQKLNEQIAEIVDIIVPKNYVLSTADFSKLKKDQTVIIYGPKNLTKEQIQISHIVPNIPKDRIQIDFVQENRFKIEVFSLDQTLSLPFFLQFQSTDFNFEIQFSSELPKKNDVIYIDIDHPQIFLNFRENIKNQINRYQYEIFDAQDQVLFQSSKIELNGQKMPEIIDLNLENILQNNLFQIADLKLELIVIGENNQVFIQKQQLKYGYMLKSNIPIICIQVESALEPPANKEKKNATYEFYDQKSDAYFLGISPVKKVKGTINTRGSGSLSFPKKSFTVSLDKKTELLGFPAHKKWTMIGGWMDKTHLANYAAYHLYQKLGHYAQNLDIAVVYLNDEYRGIYMFLEKIEQGVPRVPTADRSQGGFILQLDRYAPAPGIPAIALSSSVTYFYEYPSSPTLEEQNKISQVMNNYINALKNQGDWRALYNEEAEIDLFILNEIFANVDGYGNSKNVVYFLNEKTKKIEPIAYDFVASLGVPFFFKSYGNHSSYIMNEPALIYDKNEFPLLPYYKQDAQFTNNLKNRYRTLRTSILSDTELELLLNKLIDKLTQGKHYFHNEQRWPDLKFDRNSPEEFKEKLKRRLNYVDSQWR